VVRLPQVVALRLGLVQIQAVLALVVFMAQVAHIVTMAETSTAVAVARQELAEEAVLVEPEAIVMAAVAVLPVLLLQALVVRV
jgi:hypothetical protein